MSNILELYRHGQSVWLDYLDRNLLVNGGLKELIHIGVRGVTTNPTIFHRAVTGTAEYDSTILDLMQADHEIDGPGLYQWLAIQDSQLAADLLHPVYEQSKGSDGYVSVEVSPHLAYNTEATVEAARHLWREIARPNVMIKVPATLEGLPAIERLIAEGINVNATLLFSAARYEAVLRAYMRGLSANPQPGGIASVASVFVSRVDHKVDARLAEIGSEQAAALRGRIGVANAKLIYQRFKQLMDDPAVAEQHRRGARTQRLLWGSTSTKNPQYYDLLYVDNLIGPDTVNTVPPRILDAIQHHSEVRVSVEEDLDRARREMSALAELGVDLEAILLELETEGVQAFVDSYDQLTEALRQKRFDAARHYASR